MTMYDYPATVTRLLAYWQQKNNSMLDLRLTTNRFFNKIKQCRRIAIRYDELAANNLAFVKLWRLSECG
jgi:transposase